MITLEAGSKTMSKMLKECCTDNNITMNDGTLDTLRTWFYTKHKCTVTYQDWHTEYKYPQKFQLEFLTPKHETMFRLKHNGQYLYIK